MRALITGGAGFIGSHLSEALLTQGHEVMVLDDLSTGSVDNIAHLLPNPRFSFTIGSVTNEGLVAELMDTADMAFHLAAAVGVRLVVSAPVHTIETNVHGTETVLRQAAKQRKLVVVASTSEVYGKGTVFPFREDADLVLGQPTKTRWGYAASKLIDEFLALAYWKERQLPVIVVRFFNTVGPRQSDRYGMVIPNFVRQALAGQPLIVHGDGSQTRSFTWVGDVVSALLALVKEPRSVGEVFNIGNGAEVSIRELAENVRTMTGSSSPIHFVSHHEVFGPSFEDMSRRVPDISKLQRLVGYAPKVHLDEILERVIEFWARRSSPVDQGFAARRHNPRPAGARRRLRNLVVAHPSGDEVGATESASRALVDDAREAVVGEAPQ
jgi:nucleoside-diphosphate-sugar epimerase